MRAQPGQFILTGSATPAHMDDVHHCGIGRIVRMRMRPMALAESGESNAVVSLSSLLAGNEPPVAPCEDSSLDSLAFSLVRGGWPASLHASSDKAALTLARDYLEGLVEHDVQQAGTSRRNPGLLRAILTSYARLSASDSPLTTILADLRSADISASESTLRSYIEALRQLFVFEEAPAWNPNLRSKTAIRSMPTRHFTDPSIAAAALAAGPSDLMGDLNTFGLLFESMAVRDLRTYVGPLGGDVAHLRTKSGLECDAVVRANKQGGAYGLVEVKLGGESAIDEGAATLTKLAATIDTDRMPAPRFLMVLTAVGDFSYTRADGVHVVPIRTLGP